MLGGCWVLRGAQGAALQISGRIPSTQAMGGSPAAGQEGGGRGCWVLARGWLRQRVLGTAVTCPSSLLPAVQKDSTTSTCTPSVLLPVPARRMGLS